MATTLALGLVESATTHGEPEYRVTRILSPLLEPVLTAVEWQGAQQQAAQAVYRGWWLESESSTEVRCLEIVRLALLGEEGEIAGEIGDVVATGWVNNSRFVEALDLCQRILAVFADHQILLAIARAEVILGHVESATDHYTQALTHCPEDDFNVRSGILFNHATLIAQQGDIDRALDLWQQSLKIHERIGDVQGKAAALHQMAGVIAQQGDIDCALDLWQQSLEIYERIGNVKGKAATLHQMAGVIAQQGDIDRALDLWQQSLEIDERIGNVRGKTVTLHNMAGGIMQQGDIKRALDLWQQSLEIYEQIGDVQGKAAALNNMAGGIAQQGDIEHALDLWQQSLEILERIGDVRGKATMLSNMAMVIAQRGDIDRAFDLWQRSLRLDERIGDVRGKAVTLNNMAHVAGQTGDKVRQLDLNLQAAQALGQVRAYGDLVTVLGNLGATADHGQPYLAQALWLCLQIQPPLPQVISLSNALYQKVPQGDPLEALLAAYALYLCTQRGATHPQLPQLQELSRQMMAGAASAQGIATQEAFATWLSQQQLNDPAAFLPRLNHHLETLIGDGWAFDPTPLQSRP